MCSDHQRHARIHRAGRGRTVEHFTQLLDAHVTALQNRCQEAAQRLDALRNLRREALLDDGRPEHEVEGMLDEDEYLNALHAANGLLAGDIAVVGSILNDGPEHPHPVLTIRKRCD